MSLIATIECPAKLNTFLSVGPPDATGYHPIRSTFVAISLCDTLEIHTSDRTHVTCDWPELPAKNTLTKALSLLTELVDLPPVHLHLIKRIPVQSGLGGGSSDAAGLLRWVRKNYLNRMSRPEFESIPAAIGADVPFFMLGGRAKVEGYGEKITPLPFTGPEWFVVVQPKNALCSTPEMYRALDEKPYPWEEWREAGPFYNDFERVAPCESVDTAERLQMLGCLDAGLTGSGSAVFGSVESEEQGNRIRERVLAENLGSCWVAHSLPPFGD